MRMLATISVILLASTSAFCALPQLAELTASDGTPVDNFGWSVAMSGNTAVVGAPNATVDGFINSGKAYVFVKPDSGWSNTTQVAELTPSNASEASQFGWSVAISGDTIVVGNLSGEAYIFVKPASGWINRTETAGLSVSGAYAGNAVAIDGNTVVLGSKVSAAYVFVRPGRDWVSSSQPSAVLTPSDGVQGDSFGCAVAISGGTVVVGAEAQDVGGAGEGVGSAYVFVKPAGGWTNMTQTAELTPSNGAEYDFFGISVAINRSTIVVGSSLCNPAPVAYVFVQPVGGWVDMTETAQLEGECSPESSYAYSVAVSGNRVVVGEPHGPNDGQGISFVFRRPKTGWQTTFEYSFELSASGDEGMADQFGYSVAMSGARIVIGAIKGNQEPGAAYVF
jgi:FG-GAP repeat protein